jgi:4-hydroxybenzoate polyprenyltransferase
VAITLAVTFWTAGFDILYALADDEFDRSKNLHSVPAKFGRQRAMLISRVSHVVAVGCLLAGGLLLQAGWIYFLGVAVAAGMLIYEQSLVKPNDLSKLNMAFFTLNGYISMGVFLFALIDILVVRQ